MPMLRTRLLLVGVCAVVIVVLFQLPKVVVENESPAAQASDSIRTNIESHIQAPKELTGKIQQLRNQWLASASQEEKNAIFADSLASLYTKAGKFDSAGWYAEEAAKFFNNEKSWVKAGDSYYQAYTFSLDTEKQAQLAEKTREYFSKVLEENPRNLEVKTKMAMTYLSSGTPMQGIMMLREVLRDDPKNESAMFNLGMLSIQSGQYDKAVERLKELVEINPSHIQGRLLLGIAYMNLGDKKSAKEEFETVKKMNSDPAVQATVDSYIKDLK
jgi:tetratricopeptide (TPR) repeat protein